MGILWHSQILFTFSWWILSIVIIRRWILYCWLPWTFRYLWTCVVTMIGQSQYASATVFIVWNICLWWSIMWCGDLVWCMYVLIAEFTNRRCMHCCFGICNQRWCLLPARMDQLLSITGSCMEFPEEFEEYHEKGRSLGRLYGLCLSTFADFFFVVLVAIEA